MKIISNLHTEFYWVRQSSCKRIRFFVVLVLLMLGLTIKSYSKNYYVKSTGNDNNTGLSDEQAWSTIAKVNASSFSAGDSIFFNKGDTWRETLTVPSSGSASAYITFASYGTGNAPKILGSTDVTAWTNDAGNIWYSNIEVTDPYTLPYYGNIYFKETDGDITWGRVEKTAKVNLAVEYDWVWITNHIYIYSPTDPNTRYSGVEISQHNQSVDLDKHEYLTFDGLELAYSGRYGITCGEYPYSELSGLIVKNCNIHHFGSKAGSGGYALSLWYSDMLIKDNIIHNASRRLISLYTNNQVISPHNIIIEGNTFHDGFHSSGVDLVTNAAGTWDNIIIRNNLFYQNIYTIDAVENPKAMNLMIAEQDLLTGTINNVYIYNNIFYTPNYFSILLNHVNSVYIYNNTFCGFNTTITTQNMAYINITGAGNTSIKNNIFYNNITWAMVPYTRNISVAPTAGTVTMDNNLYYNVDPVQSLITWRGTTYTQSQWATYKSKTGQDAHSPTPGDPLFVSSSDYHLRAGSHAIDAGANMGLETDYEGNIFKNPPSIGAYEYDSQSASPAIPVYQSSSVENTTPSLIEMIYNLTLANFVPAISAFAVMVNSVTRSVSSVAISGPKVLLTLASPVVYGDDITVAYTKPSSNPLQTSSGGQAATLTAQAVTNHLTPPVPVYVSSVIQNSTPSKLEITYNLTLGNWIPSATVFIVSVNSVTRGVNSVAVSGATVTLTLASAAIYGDVITVSYTKPSSNPLQTTAGGQAASLSAQKVTNNIAVPVPVYVSSSVENATPSRINIAYNLSFANIVPPVSAFAVTVNSTEKSVISVAVSGTIAILTLASPVLYGDAITVSYTKSSSNPLQTAAGGQAASFSAQKVTNNVASIAVPAYVSSSVENATPTKLNIVYTLSLANIVPPVSAFAVTVNSAPRTVISIEASGTTVILTLASDVVYGDVVNIAYTKPSSNPLQTYAGGQAASFTAQTVSNKVQLVNTAPVVMVNFQSTTYSGFVNELNASGSYDVNKEELTFSWVIPGNIPVSSITGSKILYLSPIVDTTQKVEFTLNVSDGKTTQSKTIPVEILPYEPELDIAEVVKVEASGYLAPNYPSNTIDGNIGTMWAVSGDNQWLLLELKEPFRVHHVKLAFQAGQKKESYFDILGSEEMVTWESILTKSNSCAFSGNLQVFDFPPSKTDKELKYIKVIGHGNSTDTWNYISEFRIFGYKHKYPISYEQQPVKIYPNPAHELINIRIDETTMKLDFIIIINFSGKVVFQDKVNPDIKDFQMPINLIQGIYIVHMGSDGLTLFTQKLVVI